MWRPRINVQVIDGLIRQAKESPEGLRARVGMLHDTYERQRQRLMRHVKG